MIIKCKMCGGDIEFIPGATYGTCEYCGSTSTIPKADDEGKLNRYNRANHFRRQCEFDKAVAAYEKILEQDDTDAEAHWGAVISRYGIEYVEDPATKKRIPTCHRVQLTSILADEDYKAAVEYAPDAESRRLYEEEAARIAEIQKGILAISQHEKPYDVFICYKETDDNGQRTHDSQWAQDVYYGLTEQGYKVFFSRITLEDKLGQEYEPYIFAALNSARVMVVIGSKPEYFNAVWVKNEWSRYLALMAKDRKRLLIPCYRNMDPYDLPDELSSLQSQDMSKIGFMQDLIRGVRKVLDADKAAEQPKVVQQVVQAGTTGAAPGVSSLMDRAYLFMEDGDFDSAEEYLNRVLDIDPKHAPAYAAKVCVAFHIRKEAGLADATFQFEDNADWQKAIRFANPQQKAVYEGYAAKVRERVTLQIRNYAYDCAVEMAVVPGSDRGKLDSELAAYKASCTRSNGNRANGNKRTNSQRNEAAFDQAVRTNEPGDVTEQNLKTAASMFDAIKDDEAAASAKKCRVLAEQARQKAIYTSAVTMHGNERNNPSGLEKAAQLFMSVPEYKDAKAQAQRCVNEAESIRAGLYDQAVTAMNTAGSESSKWDAAKKKLSEFELNGYRDVEVLRKKAAKRFDECLAAERDAKQREEERIRRQAKAIEAKKKRLKLLTILSILIAGAIFFVVTQIVLPGNKYEEAVRLRDSGHYAEAIELFTSLGGFRDARIQVNATHYAEGMNQRELGDWEGALNSFALAGDYSDAKTQINETHYQQADNYCQVGRYEEAYDVYMSIMEYRDVADILRSETNMVSVHQTRLNMYYTPGYVISFGMYEQDGNTENGKERIEWIVLTTNGNRCFLISRYALASNRQSYSDERISWENSEVYSWLTKTFSKSAFSDKEKAAVSGELTLLTSQEATQYFASSEARICQPTVAVGNSYNMDGVSWWLKTSAEKKSGKRLPYKGADWYETYYYWASPSVNSKGEIVYDKVTDSYNYIRPCIWLDLSVIDGMI